MSTEGAFVYWDEPQEPYLSVVSRSIGAVVINMTNAVMESDERFLHVLAHEVFEITELKRVFDEGGGRMRVDRFYELTEPLSTVRNLHWYAWDHADSFIEQLRGENR